MKYILEFNSDEREIFEDAFRGTQYKIVLDEIDNFLRVKWKYESKTEVSIEELREFIREQMSDL